MAKQSHGALDWVYDNYAKVEESFLSVEEVDDDRTAAKIQVRRDGAPSFPLAVRRRAPSVPKGATSGLKMVEAATPIRRDGVTYEIGCKLPVDYKAFCELFEVAAIRPIAWDDLEMSLLTARGT